MYQVCVDGYCQVPRCGAFRRWCGECIIFPHTGNYVILKIKIFPRESFCFLCTTHHIVSVLGRYHMSTRPSEHFCSRRFVCSRRDIPSRVYPGIEKCVLLYICMCNMQHALFYDTAVCQCGELLGDVACTINKNIREMNAEKLEATTIDRLTDRCEPRIITF